MSNVIDHLAIIMDGNARWANQHGKTVDEGHKAGMDAAHSLLPHLQDLGIGYLTLYTLSSENWLRPKAEVSYLVKLVHHCATKEVDLLNKYNVRLKIAGDLSKISIDLRKKIERAIELTKDNTGTTLCLAFSYGGREEIVAATNKMIEAGITNVTEELLSEHLYDPQMPDVDMLIRTSGVSRVSNFLLWQIIYAEFYFIEKFWPDFTADDLAKAIEVFKSRKRNFGLRK